MTTTFRPPRSANDLLRWLQDQLTEADDLEMAEQGFHRVQGRETYHFRVYSPMVAQGEADAETFRRDLLDALDLMNRTALWTLPTSPGRLVGEAFLSRDSHWRQGDAELVLALAEPKQRRARLASLLPSEARSAELLQSALDRAGFGGGKYFEDKTTFLDALARALRAGDFTPWDDYHEGLGWMGGRSGKTLFHVMDKYGVVMGVSLVWRLTPRGYDLIARAVPATL